jgi:hypothetical protein
MNRKRINRIAERIAPIMAPQMRWNNTFSDWITKHNIHIFDVRLSKVSLLMTIPILYVVHRVIEHIVARKTELTILIVLAVVISTVLTQVIGMWINKKPPGSYWRNY